MTAYEQITRRIENLADAEARSVKARRPYMALIWRLHRAALEKKRDAMTVEQAGALV